MLITICIVFALVEFIMIVDIAIMALSGKISDEEYEKLERPDLIDIQKED